MHKIGLAIARGIHPGETTLRDPSGETAPRSYVFEEAFSPIFDETIINGTDSSRIVPKWWRLAEKFNVSMPSTTLLLHGVKSCLLRC